METERFSYLVLTRKVIEHMTFVYGRGDSKEERNYERHIAKLMRITPSQAKFLCQTVLANKTSIENEMNQCGGNLHFGVPVTGGLRIVDDNATDKHWILIEDEDKQRPIGHWLQRIGDFVFSKKTMDRIFNQIIADMQEEYDEALTKGEKWHARWIRIRGYLAFWHGVTCYVLQKIGEPVAALVGRAP